MTELELRITRVGLRSATLLQIHPDDAQKMTPLAGSPFGGLPAGQSATQGPRAYSLGVTDLSAAFASLKVEGSGARAVLASDIGAPWAAHSSQPGEYVRTRLGHVEVVLHCVGHDSFELHVDRSVADHLEAWLEARVTESPRSLRQ
jgi:sarcosine oxidase gamma subunit